MSNANHHIKEYARKLTSLSLGADGTVSEERVSAVLEALRIDPPASYKKILQAYLGYIRREVEKSTARIEYAGTISPETVASIEKSMSARYDRKITATTVENPDLIAGLRIRVADDVFESSISGQLKQLAKSA